MDNKAIDTLLDVVREGLESARTWSADIECCTIETHKHDLWKSFEATDALTITIKINHGRRGVPTPPPPPENVIVNESSQQPQPKDYRGD